MQFDSDVKDPRFAGLYGPAQPDKTQPDKAYLDDWLARTCELVDKYKPQLVWFDWWIEQPVFQPYLQKFGAFYYNRGAQWKLGVAVNYKNKSWPEEAAVLDIERGQLAGIRPIFWQTDTSISKNSWGYVQNQDYKTTDSLVDDLVDIVSKNGALLLNIGPRPDGTIPEPEQQILLEIGRWLSINGEAIYGTRPWQVFGEGPTEVVGGSFNDTKRTPFTGQDIRFTAKDSALYAIVLAWPDSGSVTIKSLAAGSRLALRKIRKVELLGSKTRLHWSPDPSGLIVKLPAQRPCDYAFVLKISGE
jgi:alpha-L-fucosidase